MKPISAKECYQGHNVLKSLVHSEWFTPLYIRTVLATEPKPDRRGSEEYLEANLQAFFDEGFNRRHERGSLEEVNDLVTEGVVGTIHSHDSLPLVEIVFFTTEVQKIARELDRDPAFRFPWGEVLRIPYILSILIAPVQLRRKVTRITMADRNPDIETDRILLSQLTRIGASIHAKALLENVFFDQESR